MLLFVCEDSDVDQGVILIGGVLRPTTTSSGLPIHPTRDGVENFWRWFSHSRVIDANGRPHIAYHGSRVPYLTQFDLHMEGTGVVNNGNGRYGGIWFTSSRENAAFFADQLDGEEADPASVFVYGDEPFYASISDVNGDRLFEVGPCDTEERARAEAQLAIFDYNTSENRGEAILDVYLSLRNPLILDGVIPRATEFVLARDSGCDGIIARNVADGHAFGDIYVAFDPAQIKSATGNNGAFDPDSPSLRDLDAIENAGRWAATRLRR